MEEEMFTLMVLEKTASTLVVNGKHVDDRWYQEAARSQNYLAKQLCN